MLQWLQLSFLFQSYPGPWGGIHGWLSLGLFALLVAASPWLAWMSRHVPDKPTSRWWRAVYYWAVWIGSVGVVFTFFAWQQVPYFGMRAWIVLLLVVLFIAAAWMGWAWFVKLPAKRAAIKARRDYEKYLPG